MKRRLELIIQSGDYQCTWTPDKGKGKTPWHNPLAMLRDLLPEVKTDLAVCPHLRAENHDPDDPENRTYHCPFFGELDHSVAGISRAVQCIAAEDLRLHSMTSDLRKYGKPMATLKKVRSAPQAKNTAGRKQCRECGVDTGRVNVCPEHYKKEESH